MNHQSVTLNDYHAIMSVLLDRFFAMKKAESIEDIKKPIHSWMEDFAFFLDEEEYLWGPWVKTHK